jgi:Secretion system C-terminal sorting domain
MEFRNCKYLLPILFLSIVAVNSFATPYLSPEEIKHQADLRAASQSNIPNILSLDELDEHIGYVYPAEYQEIFDWVISLQVTEAGPDFGGMREGEEDLDIIQTDNTQEWIRDWSRYGRLTGDIERYRQNIEDAWIYTLNFPAYLEEGGANPNYYRVHNCGWGLVAAMEYCKTYGDDAEYLAYADSCARYIDAWRLSWGNTGTQLNPLSAGFGAGTLSLYGLWRDNAEWVEAAQEIATEIKEWITADARRLNNNETWAMSGGTAMWGVVTALYLDDPVGAQTWIPTVSDSMDTYSGPGQWNNSWTVWYGHAWSAINQALDDDQSLINVKTVTDFLLDQDEVDLDGGIPATEGQYQNDQSWTSAYICWYCLETIFDEEISDYDIALTNVFTIPNVSTFWVGDQITTVRSKVANNGILGIGPPDHPAWITVQIEDMTPDVDSIELQFGEKIEFETTLSTPFLVEESEEVVISVELDLTGDSNTENNSYDLIVPVLQPVSVSGRVYDLESDEGIQSQIIWFQIDTDNPRSGESISALNGSYLLFLAPGEYEITATPYDAPYPPQTSIVTVPESGIENLDFGTPRLNVMLVSEMEDARQDTLILNALARVSYQSFFWDCGMRGVPTLEDLQTLDAVVWCTGAQGTALGLEGTLPLVIKPYLEGGGSMLLNGDGFLDMFVTDDSDLEDIFGVSAGDTNITVTLMNGIADHPITLSESMLVANVIFTPHDPDEISAVNGGLEIFHTLNTGIPTTVTYIDSVDGYKTVTCGYNVAGINSETGGLYITREEFLARSLDWMGVETGISSEEPTDILPVRWSLDAYPNPFNPVLNVSVRGPVNERAELVIFDILGRKVVSWNLDGSVSKVLWDADGHASGAYFLQLNSSDNQFTRRVILLR